VGVVTRVTFPGELDGRPVGWAGAPSPLGSVPPSFS
jgi:hypothetical protein